MFCICIYVQQAETSVVDNVANINIMVKMASWAVQKYINQILDSIPNKSIKYII